MAKNTLKQNTPKSEKQQEKFNLPKLKFDFAFLQDRRLHLSIGYLLLLFSFYFLIAFTSYLFTGKEDQSVVQAISETGWKQSGLEVENWLGLLGAWISNLFIYEWFGIASFIFIPVCFLLGVRIVYKKELVKNSVSLFRVLIFSLLWVSITSGYLVLVAEGESVVGFICGGVGLETAILLDGLLGWGTLLLMGFAAIAFIIYAFNITSLDKNKSAESIAEDEETLSSVEDDQRDSDEDNVPQTVSQAVEEEEVEFTLKKIDVEVEEEKDEIEVVSEKLEIEETKEESPEENEEAAIPLSIPEIEKKEVPEKVEIEVEEVVEEKQVGKIGTDYDSTLDLSNYKYPPVNLLKKHGDGGAKVTREELEANKNRIVETLSNYKIGIANIKATIGPTVTLYEIVPESGVRISKIKNLEDDIALSLAALGIRIIAPIPGKGTIGIEVPNTTAETVSMHEVIATEKFSNAKFDLPIALGKTISNEVFVTDLAKMPHLLMAGATGQGKSVGLNAILTSLLYKKHPSQLKFVLVDPKKVELTLYNKIERHFLAMLPDGEEAIITDTTKVVNTLNSLCMEMDQRYDLLKDAQCRNLKEYNTKFVARKLNPENGHRFLPYIVLVIDELADLMMTAGKEVETPIARLAQLARAIGIHLIVATQRPSVNVITGIIKANFPARLSFRVTSKIDSRTILDAGGADQLIGKGDMLLSLGSDLIRIQCAFVDTPEVEEICDYIGEQQGYSSAYMLPEYIGDESGNSASDVDLSERDKMFEDAARLIVIHQQGSTSLIQRKLKLGYNRAGRIIDQLEVAGIVGPFEGSKARQVLIPDEYSLEQKLRELDEM